MNLPRVLDEMVARYARNSLPSELQAELKKVAEARWQKFVARCVYVKFGEFGHYQIRNDPTVITEVKSMFHLQGKCDPRFRYVKFMSGWPASESPKSRYHLYNGRCFWRIFYPSKAAYYI